MVKLNFAHLCDMAFLSKEGKANIIGIFKTIYSHNFPVIHPKFSIVTSIIVIDEIRKHKEIIKIIRENDKKEIGPIINASLEVTNGNQEMNFIADINMIAFEKPGKYNIKILFDDKEIYSIPFEVTKL